MVGQFHLTDLNGSVWSILHGSGLRYVSLGQLALEKLQITGGAYP